MKIIIFAGGHGTRLWPLSRKNSPKQFEQVFEGKSTLQLAVERIEDIVNYEDIYISTNQKFQSIIKSQLPNIPEENIILEPAKRDLAAAVGLAFYTLKKKGIDEPVAILWADHLMQRPDEFRKALLTGEELIKENPNRFVYLGETPRFANHNLGWITVGEKTNKKDNLEIYEFKSWKYRPDLQLCRQMFESGQSLWNPGYWITSIDFVINLYRKLKPEMAAKLEEITSEPDLLAEIYPTLESISFDDAIIEETTAEQAVVVKVDLGWSDPGTLYALKEALQESPKSNVLQGNVEVIDSSDCLLINKEEGKLVAGVGLQGMVVINTKDAIAVVHKDDVPKIKDLVKQLEDNNKSEFI